MKSMEETGLAITKQTEMEQNREKSPVNRKINPIQSSTGHLFPFPMKVFILCSCVPFYIRGKFSKCTVCPWFSSLPSNQNSIPECYTQDNSLCLFLGS